MDLLVFDEKGAPATIALADVCLIRPTKKGPEFVTAQGVYRFAQTASQLQRLYGDYGFETLDRNAIVNKNKAIAYDAEARVVYFGDEGQGDSLYATVSRANEAKVRHLIKESAGFGDMYVTYEYGRDSRTSYGAAFPAA